MNILFVCSRNQWRSPTAETIYKALQGLTVRSAGTEPSARIRLSAKHIAWADLIFAMEKRHKQRITERFREEIAEKEIIVLDIADEYGYMDPELIEAIKISVEPHLRYRGMSGM